MHSNLSPARKQDAIPESGDLSLGLHERLALISLMNEEARNGQSDSPMVADLFDDLWNLVDRTVSGASVHRMRPDGHRNGFKVLEITARQGEILGRLNMLYLNKPIPCYYLVYVEVLKPFRNKGLGTLVLEAFKDFLTERSALGILDNIIPRNDPTFDIYAKLDWQPFDAVLPSSGAENDHERYMIFIPASMSERNLKSPLQKLVHHLNRKRPAIEMRENEFMVRRTIQEFRELYDALMVFFDTTLKSKESDPIMQYMFTRYVTKFLGFRRRIQKLLGYTGGESLSQVVLDERVRRLPVQSYAPKVLSDSPSFVSGDRKLWLSLPETLKNDPGRCIEALPNYRRPSLVTWLAETNRNQAEPLTIGDLLELNFDPTRLKEFSLGNQKFIFERLQPNMLPALERKKQTIESIETETHNLVLKNVKVHTNPPLLIIRDRGNAYVLRRKVQGIHWEEAREQLQTNPSLVDLNKALPADRIITSAIKAVSDWCASRIADDKDAVIDPSTFFVSWNLESNRPILNVDMAGASVESVWIA